MIFDDSELIRIAASARARGDIEHAMELYQQAVDSWAAKVNESSNQDYARLQLAIAHGGLGECYADIGAIDSAEHFSDIANKNFEALFDETRDFHILNELVLCTQNRAVMALNKDDITKCEQLLQSTEEWIKKMKLIDTEQLATQAEALQYRIRADIARQMGSHQTVLRHITQAAELADQVWRHKSGRYEINLWLSLVCYQARTHSVLHEFEAGLKAIAPAVDFIDSNSELPTFLKETKVSQLEVMLEYHLLLRKTGASYKLLNDIAERAAQLIVATSNIDNHWMNALREFYQAELGSSI
ncbi:hypothetical protein [Idiomarina ramblicola]|uniref:MalT-like TPR region domain-containing protein n=1 Tax=Idiomarina ramblicola TaxID=263724 RepID=A0A432Z077_9GAMM|nr:hypothetical protein [Idiomarina ramblicola]RUO69586.1 hypothetical protein CWI78_06590 [Idiomarina ramblicola]